jgi:hypothetical protein
MKGTFIDFLKLAAEKPELAQELVDLAAKHDFTFTDEVSDEDLEKVAGGAVSKIVMDSLTGGGLPDGLTDPTTTTPSSGSGVVPSPYPNIPGDGSQGGNVEVNPVDMPSGGVSKGDVAG